MADLDDFFHRIGLSRGARREALTLAQRHRVYELAQLLQDPALLRAIEDRYPYAIPGLRTAMAAAKTPARKPEAPAASGPTLATDPVAWARAHGVDDILAWPYSRVVHGDWFEFDLTVGAALQSRSLRQLADLHAFLVNAAKQPVPPPARPPPAFPALADFARRADAYVDAARPPLRRPAFRVVPHEADPVLRLELDRSVDCREKTFWIHAEGPEVVRCACPSPPPSCRARRWAVEWTRERLGDSTWYPGARLSECLGRPVWARTLAMLPLPEAPLEGELGWAIDRRSGVEIKPLLLKPARNGGWKSTYLDKERWAELARNPNTDPEDAWLLSYAPYLSGRSVRLDLVIQGLSRLARHGRVFDAETREPRKVVNASVVTSLRRLGPGFVVEWRVDGQLLDADSFVRQVEERGVAGRLLLLRPGGPVVANFAAATARLAAVLVRRGQELPIEALPELLRHLAAMRIPVEIDPELPVAAVPAAARVLVRLEAGDPLLHVQIRVRSHPALPALRPGEGEARMIAQQEQLVVQVERDLARERAAADAVVQELQLGAEESWSWGVDDPERAIEVVGALRDREDLTVEWSGRRPKLKTATGKALRVQVGGQNDWFGVGGALEIDGTAVPLEDLLAAMAGGRSWVRAQGEVWVRIETRLRDRLRALADAAEGGRIAPVHAPVVTALQEEGATVDAPPAWLSAVDRIAAAAALRPELPAGLRAELRPYQREGHAWITRLLHWAGGAVLADDMGLGKTVQALAVLLDRAAGPQLVVAPMSVGFNWVREAERFAPSLRVHLHHGADRPDDLAHLGPGDLVVTTWDILVRDEALRTPRWATVVFDEAQAMKNAETQRAKAAAALQADARLALTGTPVENRLFELWSLLNVVVPGLLGGQATFRGRFAVPIERYGDAERRAALARMVRPFVLRRVKAEVARDLPPRTEVRVDVELDANERSRYDQLRAASLAALAQPGDAPEQARFKILAALTRLRQLACAPRLVDDAAPQRSSKVERAVEMLAELREEGRKALVFSQFAELVRLVKGVLEAEGWRCCHLDGSTPAAARRAEVDRFQAGEADVFLISLKAGGTGLNLTAATEVILLDPWWNPAVEDQAADRTHRIGQSRAVTVYRLVARGTVEEAILDLHAKKRDLAGAVLEGTGDAGALAVEDLMALLSGGEAPKLADRKPPALPLPLAKPKPAPTPHRTEALAPPAAAARDKPAPPAEAARVEPAPPAEAARDKPAPPAEAAPDKPAPPPEADPLERFERALKARHARGEISRSTVSNTVNPLRRLRGWAGSLEGVEARLDEWRAADLDLPGSDRGLVPTALRRLREWEAGGG